jgi:hypothetical protein
MVRAPTRPGVDGCTSGQDHWCSSASLEASITIHRGAAKVRREQVVDKAESRPVGARRRSSILEGEGCRQRSTPRSNQGRARGRRSTPRSRSKVDPEVEGQRSTPRSKVDPEVEGRPRGQIMVDPEVEGRPRGQIIRRLYGLTAKQQSSHSLRESPVQRSAGRSPAFHPRKYVVMSRREGSRRRHGDEPLVAYGRQVCLVGDRRFVWRQPPPRPRSKRAAAVPASFLSHPIPYVRAARITDRGAERKPQGKIERCEMDGIRVRTAMVGTVVLLDVIICLTCSRSAFLMMLLEAKCPHCAH